MGKMGIRNIINIPLDSMKVVSYAYGSMSVEATKPWMLID